ncbi:MAG: hypothetical protein ACREIB_00705 [Pseudomonadota bacterium]
MPITITIHDLNPDQAAAIIERLSAPVENVAPPVVTTSTAVLPAPVPAP